MSRFGPSSVVSLFLAVALLLTADGRCLSLQERRVLQQERRILADRAFVREAHAYGLLPTTPDALAIWDGRQLCNRLTLDYWGPRGAFRPEWAHFGTLTTYASGRAAWLAATVVYCPRFLASVHTAYRDRGAPAYHGPALHVPPQALPHDYPPGGLCIVRYSNWVGFNEVCPDPIP